MQLILSQSDSYYSEIGQTHDVRFSFLNKKEEVCHEMFKPIKCRDFLGDCIAAEKEHDKYTIYGFSYNSNTQKLDRDRTRFSLHFPNNTLLDNFINNILLLNQIEKINNLEETISYTTQYKDKLIIEGDAWWLGAVWKISLYTFLLKLCTYKNDGGLFSIPTECTEATHIKTYKLTEQDFTKLLTDVKKVNWSFYGKWGDKYPGLNNAHDYSGIMCTLKEYKNAL